MTSPSTFFITNYYRPVVYNNYTGAIPNIPDIVQILGKATYSNEPEITDNKVAVFYTMNYTEQKKLGDSIINNSDNTWIFTTSPLPSGNYQFYAGRLVNNQWVYSNSSSNITILSTPSPTFSPTSSLTPVKSNRFWDFLFIALALVAGVILFYFLYSIQNRYLRSSVDIVDDTQNMPLLPNRFTRRISRELQWWKKDEQKPLKQQVQKTLTPQQKKQIQQTDIFTLQNIKDPVLGNDFLTYDGNSLRQHVKFPYRFRSSRGGMVTKILPLQQAFGIYKAETNPRQKQLKKRDIARYVALLEKLKEKKNP